MKKKRRILASNPQFSLIPFEKALKKVEREFDGWEILAEKYHGWGHKEQIKDALTTTDIYLQVHAPLNDINIASINPSIRKASMKEIKRSLELGSMIGADLVTVHPGLYSPLSIYCDDVLEISKSSLKELKKSAENLGLKLAVENLPEMWLSLCSEPDEIKEIIGDTEMNFCLDIGHAYTAGKLDEFLDLPIIPANIHIHDNKGGEDVHLPLGEGEIEFETVLEALEDYEGNFVIEGRGMDGLVESKRYLKRLINQ